MKRIAIPALLLACFVLIVPSGRNYAEQEKQENMGHPKAHKVPKGVQITKYWEKHGAPQWPQVAQLLLPADEYKKYLAAPEDYVNALGVFSPSSTHKIAGCNYAPLPTESPKDKSKPQCMVLLSHEHPTTSSGISSCSLEW
jgi:hypothetical protein